MAYDPDVPPSLIHQGVGGPTGLRWFAHTWIDPIANVLQPGYITNAHAVGIRAGDALMYKDVNRGEWDHYDLIVQSLDESGAASLAFPEVPEEAMAQVEDLATNDGSAYVVIYKGGRMARMALVDFVAAIKEQL